MNEALHLSEREREMVVGCFLKIRQELEHAIDRHSKRLIAINIEMLLDYCLRFYERQFITRSNVNHDILARFERLLDDYFAGDRAQREGLPSVKWCAGELCLSPNYFGDLIKKETGKSAQEYIQLKLIATAKERILAPDKTIGQVAYELGFQYPQHFTRLFKKITGLTPTNTGRRNIRRRSRLHSIEKLALQPDFAALFLSVIPKFQKQALHPISVHHRTKPRKVTKLHSRSFRKPLFRISPVFDRSP